MRQIRIHLLVVVMVLIASVHQASGGVRALIEKGARVPSARPDAVLANIETVRVNQLGELLVTADASSPSGSFSGVWQTSAIDSPTSLIIEDGAQVPGVTEAVVNQRYAEDFSSVLGKRGGVGLIFEYEDPAGGGYGTWYDAPGANLSRLLLHRDPAPGIDGYRVFDPEFGGTNGPSGWLNIVSQIESVNSPEADRRNATWLRDAAAEFHLVATTGTLAPGFENAFFVDEPRIPWINSSGQFLLQSRVSPTNSTIDSQQTLWKASNGIDGPLEKVLTEGDVLADGAGSSISVSSFNVTRFNARGDFVVAASDGVWLYEEGTNTYQHLASSDDSRPDGGSFEQISVVDLSDDGETLLLNSHPVWHANYGSGLWLATNDRLEEVVGAGDESPDGKLFSLIGESSRNQAGQIAFSGLIENETQFERSDDAHGIWAYDRDGGLHKIVAEGDSILLDDGRRLDLFEPRLLTIDDEGRVFFSANYQDPADGTGVFVSDVVVVPEPASHFLALIALTLAACKFRVRARRSTANL